MCLPPANARIWPNPQLYFAVYHRYSLKSFQLCKSAQTYWYRKYFGHIVAQGDSSCLTIANIKPELCPNSAPLYNPMSVVDNSAPLFFHSSHFNCNNNKFKHLSIKGIKRKYKQNIQNAAFYHPWIMLLTSFSKHSVLIPLGQSVSAVTGGVEYFREYRQHTCTISFTQRLCAVYLRDNIHPPPPCYGRRTLPTRDLHGMF